MQTRSISAIKIDPLLVRGRRVAIGLVAVGIAYALAHAVWRFAGSAETRVVDESIPAQVDTASAPASTEDVKQGTLRNPFSGADGNAGVASAANPTRTLNLVGILALGEKSLAVIATDTGERVVSVGDAVSGDVTVKAIFTDRVLLQGIHGVETLWLDKTRAANPVAALPSASDAQQGQSELPGSLTDYRDRFLNAPTDHGTRTERFSSSELVEYFTPATTPTGELMGYRLSPNSREPHYQQLGLQPGDVITTVNGIPLTQEDNSVRGLRRLRSDGLASITVIRDRNKIIDITIMREEESKASE